MAVLNWKKAKNSGNRTGFALTVMGTVKGERGVKGLKGKAYLAEGENELPIGSLVIDVYPTGSVKNGGQDCNLVRITAEQANVEVDPWVGAELLGRFNWKTQFCSLQTSVEAALDEAAAHQALAIPAPAQVEVTSVKVQAPVAPTMAEQEVASAQVLAPVAPTKTSALRSKKFSPELLAAVETAIRDHGQPMTDGDLAAQLGQDQIMVRGAAWYLMRHGKLAKVGRMTFAAVV